MFRLTKEILPGEKPMRPGKPPLMVDPYPGKPMRPKPKPDPRPGKNLPQFEINSRNGSGITGPAGRSVNKIYNTY